MTRRSWKALDDRTAQEAEESLASSRGSWDLVTSEINYSERMQYLSETIDSESA